MRVGYNLLAEQVIYVTSKAAHDAG